MSVPETRYAKTSDGVHIAFASTGEGVDLIFIPGFVSNVELFWEDPDAYGKVLVEHLGPLRVAISAEPGDYLCKEMGVLLAEVVTVEERDGTWFAGVDAGYNVAPERFIYG